MVKIIAYLLINNKHIFNLTHKNNLLLKFIFIFSFILLIYYKNEFNILFNNICKIPKLSGNRLSPFQIFLFLWTKPVISWLTILIPNLVNTVKGYAKHESTTLENVIKARNVAMGQQETMKERAQSENILTGTLKSLFAVSENYPELKADKNFLELQREVRDTEDKLQAARRFYNGNVLSYNTKLEMFPSNVVAAVFHFEKKEFFELEDAEKEAVKQAVKVEF